MLLGLGERVKVLIRREVKQLRAERNKFGKRPHITITCIEYEILDSMGKCGYRSAHGHNHKLTTLILCDCCLEGNRWLKVSFYKGEKNLKVM